MAKSKSIKKATTPDKPVLPLKEKLTPKPFVFKEPKPQKPKPPDYDISYDQGSLDDDHEIHRVFVIDGSGKMVLSIDGDLISCGFGTGRNEAVKDFIQRNNSIILNKIYERKKK